MMLRMKFIHLKHSILKTTHLLTSIIRSKERGREMERKKERERIFHTALEMMDAVSHWITEMKKISR